MPPYNPRDPLVGVAQDRRILGVSDLAFQADATGLVVLPLSVALLREWRSDACLTTYLPYIKGSPVDKCPRLNKKGPVLEQLRTRGVEIMHSCLILDYDNPGHRPWTPLLEEAFQESLLSVVENDFALGAEWNWAYTTPHGARLIYLFAKPVTPEVYEAISRGVIKQFTDCGLALDPLPAWNHLFACPKQVRDGLKPPETWNYPHFEIHQRREDPHSPDNFPTTTEEAFSTYSKAEVEIPEGLPDYDAALDLVRDRVTHKLTSWGKKARRRLQGRDCYDCLFKDELLASEGSRDNTIHSFVGQATALLIGLVTDEGQETTPEHIFGLFFPAVEQLEGDEQTPDWNVTLWGAIRRWWVIEFGKLQERKAVSESRECDANEQQIALLQGAREWCSVPELFGREDIAWNWLSRRMLVCLGKQFYVMAKNGYYTGPVNKDMIHSQVVDNGIDKALELYHYDEKGGSRAKNPQELLNDYAITVSGCVGRAGGAGHFIEGADTTNPRMVLSLYRRRTDLVPQYDADVDTWLKKLFGTDWEIAAKWLAWALAFEEGAICALSLEGKKGSGKKMLVEGLAECLEIPELATSRDLVGDHQEGLMRSPFVVVDEGWPNKKAYMSPADMFRHLVSGDPTQVNPKFKSVIRVHVPARVIFTANNLNVVKELTDGKTLSPDDREAIAQRLLHVSITPEASNWLERKGGSLFTGRKGQRWIAKESGGGSDFVVARHFLWLYEQRHHLGRHGNRFLVEGPLNSTIMFELRTQSGMTPVVTETIIGMLNSAGSSWGRKGFLVRAATEEKRGEVWVLAAEIKKFYEQSWKPGNERLTSATINEVLRGLVDRPTVDRVLEDRESLKVKRWHSIDIHLMNLVAKRFGWICPTLEQLVDGATVHTIRDAKKAATIRLATNKKRDKKLSLKGFKHGGH